MVNRILQIQEITKDDLLNDFENVIKKFGIHNSKKVPAKINILNRKSAARILDCSLKFFDKLRTRGCVPHTVMDGVNKKTGRPVLKWCEYHLIEIKPLIDKLKYSQDDKIWADTSREIHSRLGL